jgi:hypothetical protein
MQCLAIKAKANGEVEINGKEGFHGKDCDQVISKAMSHLGIDPAASTTVWHPEALIEEQTQAVTE